MPHILCVSYPTESLPGAFAVGLVLTSNVNESGLTPPESPSLTSFAALRPYATNSEEIGRVLLIIIMRRAPGAGVEPGAVVVSGAAVNCGGASVIGKSPSGGRRSVRRSARCACAGQPLQMAVTAGRKVPLPRPAGCDTCKRYWTTCRPPSQVGGSHWR